MQFKGFLNGNADTESHPEFARIVDPESTGGWGTVCHPDELRMVWFMGNSELVTQNGAYYTDEMLANIVDRYVGLVSEALNYDIYPVSRRHRPTQPQNERRKEPHEVWEDGYQRRNSNVQSGNFLALRHRPVIRVEKWIAANPFNGDEVLNLLERGCQINYMAGTLRNTLYRDYGTMQGGHPGLSGYGTLRTPVRHGFVSGREQSYFVDYVTGHESAAEVPQELREVISRHACIHIMSGYGDGLVGGMASFSISLGTQSESIGTTMSATSAMFGARILEMTNFLKEWWGAHGGASRYRKPQVSVL